MEEEEEEEEVVIVGAGITGLATALALYRVGVRSLVLEKSEELRATGSALYLFPNAWLALDALQISHKLTPFYPPLTSGSVTDLSTGSVHQIFSGDGEGPRVVHRKALLEALAEELPPDSIRFSSPLTSIQKELGDDDASLVVARLKDGTTIKSKVLIGCDGLHSVVAKWLGLAAPLHSGRSAFRGIAVYPEGHGLGSSYQQFVDSGNKGGITPLTETEVYWLLTCHSRYDDYDPIETTENIIKQHIPGFPTVFLDVVRNTDPSSVSCVPLMLRNPWSIVVGNLSRGNVAVAGDAMHPMTPDLGQGGGSALEDAVVLGRHIGNYMIGGKKKEVVKEEMAGVLNGYVKERRWRAAGLVAGSYVAGWVQQSGSSWWRKVLRVLFQKYLFRLGKYLKYDCGELPAKVEMYVVGDQVENILDQ